MEVVEFDDRLGGAAITTKPASLRPLMGWTGWLARRLGWTVGRPQTDRFVLVRDQFPAELLGDHHDFSLIEFDPDGRPVLQVLPGMTGEMRIGVSRMSVAQMLADPSLQLDPDGDRGLAGARLPLPYGARLQIHCGPKTFVARIGGQPFNQLPNASLESAASHTQLATA